jgi:peptide subunit release factor 1 (eRF1)
VRQLESEVATAANIKDKVTGKSVVGALRAIIDAIKASTKQNKLPANGLICFAGYAVGPP